MAGSPPLDESSIAGMCDVPRGLATRNADLLLHIRVPTPGVR
jgi:hypothetical protein